MRIGINTLFLRPGKVGGTETYLRNLIQELILLDKENQYVLFTNQESAKSFNPLPSSWQEVVCDISSRVKPYRVYWEQRVLPRKAEELKIDVLHSPGYVSVTRGNFAKVVTIHSMHYYYTPEFFSFPKRWYWKYWIPKSARVSDIVISVSESLSKDISTIMKIPKDRIRTTPLAVSPVFSITKTKDEIDRFLKNIKISQPYLLCVATFNRHKNLIPLVRSFSKMKQQYTCPHQLVLVGIKTDYFEQVNAEIQKSDYKNDIHVLSPYPNEELPLLYQGADLFVLLSLVEGFGLPVLEAMAGGTPVLCSNRTSLPEVAGDAAILVDPEDESAIVTSLINLLQNPELRKSLSEKGKEQVKKFSWRKTAELTLSAYQDAFTIWKEKNK